ncbi:hypothetical protein [Enterococcus innesii]|uniref:hypothetical protein n=1 Tax=Enterococcus innesii TaxID=2839759 RepID=UPI0034A2869A
MKKTLFTIIMTAAVTAGATICIMNAVHSESKADQQTIETEKVKIKYFDVENGDFDILITPKKGYNIGTEWTLSDDKFYKEGYLVGTTKENAEKRVKAANKVYNINWTLSWDN